MKFSNVKIGSKLAAGFGLILILLLAISAYNVIRFNETESLSKGALRDGGNVSFMLGREIDHLEWTLGVTDLFLRDEVTTLKVQTDDHLCNLGLWMYGDEIKELLAEDKDFAAIFKELEEPHSRLHESAININKTYVAFDTSLSLLIADRWQDHLLWIEKLSNTILFGEEFLGGLDPHQCAFGKWYDTYTATDPEFAVLLTAWESPHENLHLSAVKIVEAMDADNIELAKEIYRNETEVELDRLSVAYNKTVDWIDKKSLQQEAAAAIFLTDTDTALRDTQGVLAEIEEHFEQKAEEASNSLSENIKLVILLIVIISASALLLGILAAVIITVSITKPLQSNVIVAGQLAQGDLTVEIEVKGKDETGQLSAAMKNMATNIRNMVVQAIDSTQNVAAGSQALSATAQQISQGATEQAAAAEEVSSSMEEMSSSIQQNADNALQTDKIAVKAAQDAQVSGEAVNNAVGAMKDIASKISIIEEISRQTNLLALNAAIEAARAGEHGKGFAVVASEVRKLAERSQTAAGEISELSNSTVEAATQAGQMLDKLVPDIKKTAELVQEISASTSEQKTGADQINSAILQLDQVIQQNASASEEMASTSEELSAQSEILRSQMEFFKVGNTTRRKINGNKALPGSSQYLELPAKNQISENPKETGIRLLLDDEDNRDSIDDNYESF